jgi:predicted ester cyclase
MIGSHKASADPKAIVDRFLRAVLDEHDFSGIDELVANEGLIEVLRGFLAACPDLEAIREQLVAEGNVVAVRVSAEATHLGELRGVAATGKRWRATASAWYLVEDGKITDYWVNWDWLAIFEQVGAVRWVHSDAEP